MSPSLFSPSSHSANSVLLAIIMAWRVLALQEMNWTVLVWTNPLLLTSRMNGKLIIPRRHEKINA